MSETNRLLCELEKRIETNQQVLLVWNGTQMPEDLQRAIEKINTKRGTDHKINVDFSHSLKIENYSKSSFDLIFTNDFILNSSGDSNQFGILLLLLKPKSQLITVSSAQSSLLSNLRVNGFVNLVQTKIDDQYELFVAEKPNFEVGASSRLKFAKPVSNSAVEKPKFWQFNSRDIADDDLINTNELLDESDLKKPVISENFDCGESKIGKKKACKNCSCGLAEELEKSTTEQKNESYNKSACGNCYLGDAFRCASCPYLGMPAFKPGEKVQLGESLNKSDI